MRGAEGKGTGGLQAGLAHFTGGCRKASFVFQRRYHHCFLVPEHPGRKRLFPVDLTRQRIRLAAARAHVPGNLVRALVELCNRIKSNDLAEFLDQDVEQIPWCSS